MKSRDYRVTQVLIGMVLLSTFIFACSTDPKTRDSTQHWMLSTPESRYAFEKYKARDEGNNAFKVVMMSPNHGWRSWIGPTFEQAYSAAHVACLENPRPEVVQCELFAVGNTIVWDMTPEEKEQAIARYKATKLSGTLSAAPMMEHPDLGFKADLGDRWTVKDPQSKSGASGWIAYVVATRNGTEGAFLIASGARRSGEDYDAWSERQVGKVMSRYGPGNCSRREIDREPVDLSKQGATGAEIVKLELSCSTYKAIGAYVRARRRDDKVWFMAFGWPDRNHIDGIHSLDIVTFRREIISGIMF